MPKKKDKYKLTTRQELFCREYVADPEKNATQALIKAGYKSNTAEVQASRMLRNANIQAFIKTLMAKTIEKLEIKSENILRELDRLANTDITSFFEVSEDGKSIKLKALKDLDGRAIQRIKIRNDEKGRQTIEFNLWDKVKPLELLGKNKELWVDKKKEESVQTVKVEMLDYEDKTGERE